MASAVVEWSELCNTDPSVALAYYSAVFADYSSRVHTSVENILRPVQSEAVDTYRDALRNVVGGGCCRVRPGDCGGDGCSCRGGRGVVPFCGNARVGGERLISGHGCELGRIEGAKEWACAGGVCESNADVETNDGTGRRDGRAVHDGHGSGGEFVGDGSAGCGDGADGELAEGVKGVTGVRVAAGFPLRGPNYERNRRNRERRKQAKRDVQKLCAEKVQAQNELAVLEAKRKIEVLKARDVEQEKRADRVRIQRSVERDMVAIEKSHATLRATGNVPGEMGFCETIVGSGSISPDSSASQADVRAMKKELEDGKLENEKLKKILKRHGLPAVDPDLYDKHTWTDNEENMQLLDEMYPDGCAFNDVYAPPGKVHVVGY